MKNQDTIEALMNRIASGGNPVLIALQGMCCGLWAGLTIHEYGRSD